MKGIGWTFFGGSGFSKAQETEEMTRVRDELRQLEEQRVAQEEARQEEEQKNQRLAAEFQQQLSEWQQRSGRQTAELEEYLTEMESCRRDSDLLCGLLRVMCGIFPISILK